jgi:hypothetical protein
LWSPGNRAGIDDVCVGISLNRFPAGVEEIREAGIGLKLVQPAAKGLNATPFRGPKDEG